MNGEARLGWTGRIYESAPVAGQGRQDRRCRLGNFSGQTGIITGQTVTRTAGTSSNSELSRDPIGWAGNLFDGRDLTFTEPIVLGQPVGAQRQPLTPLAEPGCGVYVLLLAIVPVAYLGPAVPMT